MNVCKKTEKFINEVDDVSRVARVIAAKEKAQFEREAVARVKRTGQYSIPSKRISPYIDKTGELLGKMITLEPVDGNSFENVKVRTAKMVGHGVVEVNGKYRIVLARNQTLDGMYMVSIDNDTRGSEGRFTADNSTKLSSISGQLLSEIGGLVEQAIAMDGDRLSETHKNDMLAVFRTYRDTLSEAGKDVEITVEFLQGLANTETAGEAEVNNSKIKLLNGNKEFNTATDILAHEMQHVLIDSILKTNGLLRTKVMKLRDAMAKEVDWKVFLPDMNEYTSAQEAYAKERWQYVFANTSKGEGVAAGEFLAAATTNERLIAKMKLIDKPGDMVLIRRSERVNEKGKEDILTKLWNVVVDAINIAYRAAILPENSQVYAKTLLEEAMRIRFKQGLEQEKAWYTKAISMIAKADNKMRAFSDGKLTKAYKTVGDRLASNDASKMDKVIEAMWRVKALARVRSYVLQNKLFSTVLTDMSDPNISKFYEMFKHSKAFVDDAVAPMTQKTVSVLNKDHRLEKLSSAQKDAAKRVLLDTDAKILGNSEDILEYLRDMGETDRELTRLVNILDDNVKDEVKVDKIIVAAEAVAKLLVTNKMTMKNGYVNAAQIGQAYLNKTIGPEVEAIDKMISLIALKETPSIDRELARLAIENEPAGLDYAMNLVRHEEKQLLKQAYRGNPVMAVKGALHERFDDNKAYYLVDEKEAKQLVKAGLVNTGKHEGLSTALGKDMFMVVGDSLEIGYTEGLMSKVQLKNEGDSVKRILMDQEGMSEEEASEAIELLNVNVPRDGAALVPERDSQGIIYDYRVRIPQEVKSKYLGLKDDIAWTVGNTVSNLTHKQEAMLNNYSAVDELNKFYKKYKNSKKYNFIEISPNSKGKFKEYWDGVPHYLKKYVGGPKDGKLMIEESLLIDMFGYKDVSVINAPWIKDNKKRQMIARKIEKMVMELAKGWKDSIVAKSWETIKGNALSNAVVTIDHMEDKNVARYLEQMTTYWGEMNKYQRLKDAKIKLELDKKAGVKGLESKIAGLEADMQSNVVNQVIEDGQYSAILEDINTEWFNNVGPIEEKLNELLSAVKLGKKVNMKDIADALYIKKGSRFHDSVMKLTLYMDVLNKVIILEEFKRQANEMRVNGKTNAEIGAAIVGASEKEIDRLFKTGKTPQTWLNYVDGLFVNYSYLDNRHIKYANDTLIFSFTKYFFRVLPGMLKMAKNRGASLFFTEAMKEGAGLGVESPVDQFYDPIGSILHKVGGIMNPWDNAMEIATVPVFK